MPYPVIECETREVIRGGPTTWWVTHESTHRIRMCFGRLRTPFVRESGAGGRLIHGLQGLFWRAHTWYHKNDELGG